MQELKYSNCFVCGPDNPHGLKLDFYLEGDRAYTSFDSPRGFEGYKDVIHGGIIATLLDEVMAKIIISNGLLAVTADLSVRYRKPLPVGTKVKVWGEISMQKSRTIHAKAAVEDEAGNVFSEATAVYIVMKGFG